MTTETRRTRARRGEPARADGPVAGVDAAPKRWPDRTWLARTIRFLVFLVPIVLSFVVAYLLSGWLASPDPFWARVVRWLFIAVLATLVMIAAQRLMRRLLPLAVLFSLTLVFPDETPSRFGLALRGMSARQLEKKLVEVDEQGLGDTPTEAAESLLTLVAALSRHDRLTRGHSERVRAYSIMIGEELGLDAAELDQLRWAALLHDVGKLHVPFEVLNKPGELTDAEYDVIKQHTVEGQAMVAPLAGWLGDAADAVHQHHERFEGGGYPTGVPAEELPLASRIVSVADAFDVMTSARSYKAPASARAARAELERCSGTQFDPVVVRAMMNISLGRLWRAMGPMSWIAQVGLFPRPLTQGGAATTTALAALLSLLLTGIASASQGGSRDADLVDAAPPTSIVASSGNAAGADRGGAASGDGETPPPPADEPSDEPVEAAAVEESSSTTSTTTPITTPPPPTSPTTTTALSSPGATSASTTTTTTEAGRLNRPPVSRPRTTRPPRQTLPRSTTVPPRATTTTIASPDTTTTAPPSTVGSTTTTTAGTTTSTTIAATTTTTTTTTTSTTTTTTTTSTTTTTTTTVPTAPAREFTLAAPGPGDQPWQELLDLEPLRAVQNATLPNLDTDRNGDPGLTVVRTSQVLVTDDPAGVQTWRFPSSFTTIDGDVTLTLYVAPDGTPGSGQLIVRAGIFDCDEARTDCTRIVRDTPSLTPTEGVFEPVTFDLSLPATPYVIAPGRRLELRFAVLNGSSNDVWIGYDADTTPAQLVVDPPAGGTGLALLPFSLLALGGGATLLGRRRGRVRHDY